MNRHQVFEYVQQHYHIVPDYPWRDDSAVLRHTDNHKWFALILKVHLSKLGLPEEGFVDIINIKCDPMLSLSLRTKPGYHPAYHMNKEKWLSIRLDGSAPDEEIMGLIDLSYELTQSPKKRGVAAKKGEVKL